MGLLVFRSRQDMVLDALEKNVQLFVPKCWIFFLKHRDSPAVYEEVVLNIFQWKWLESSILPEANIAPEKWWLGTPLILGRPIFRWYVSFREGNHSNP